MPCLPSWARAQGATFRWKTNRRGVRETALSQPPASLARARACVQNIYMDKDIFVQAQQRRW